MLISGRKNFMEIEIVMNVIKKLEEMGWNVITIWECELKKDKRKQTLEDLYTKIISK